MPNLPQVFRRSAEKIIPSSYTDIITGRGYVTFYAGDCLSASGAGSASPPTYILRTNEFYSDYGISASGGLNALAGTSNNKAWDLDFDLEIEKPILMEGEGFISVPVAFQVDGTNGPVDVTLSGAIAKVSGGSEEIIASGVTYKVQLAGAAATQNMLAVKVDIPRTTFKIGDTLRLNIKTSAPGNNRAIILAFDPKNRTALPDPSTQIGFGTCTWTTPTILSANLPLIMPD